MAIQRNTAISETVLTVVAPEPGFQFHLLNEWNLSEEIRYFEKPGMMIMKCCGVKFENENPRIAFVNDLDDPASPPFFW